MKITPKTVFLISLVSLVFAIASYASGGGPLATVTRVKGSPQIIKASVPQAAALKIGETIEYGDTVITDSDSKATLIFNDGEIRVITSGSNVKFNEGDKAQNDTQMAKVASTLADAVNAKNLDSTFESVTGIKLSMSSAKEKPKSAPAPPPMVSAPAPASPVPSDELPAGEALGGQAPVPKAEEKKSSDLLVAARTQKPSEAPGGAALKSGIKKWHYWFDDENSIPWELLIPGSVLGDIDKITFKTSSSVQDIKNLKNKLSLSAMQDGVIVVSVLFKNKGNVQTPPLRAELVVNEKRKNIVIEELKKISGLQNDDPETYLYVKSSIFKQNQFYIAALAALNELEKLQPGVKMPHVLKSKAVIYHAMGEKELARAAAERLK